MARLTDGSHFLLVISRSRKVDAHLLGLLHQTFRLIASPSAIAGSGAGEIALATTHASTLLLNLALWHRPLEPVNGVDTELNSVAVKRGEGLGEWQDTVQFKCR